jgi:hypothetical protein
LKSGSRPGHRRMNPSHRTFAQPQPGSPDPSHRYPQNRKHAEN